MLVSPLQLAVAYAALANGGTVFEPRLAKAIVAPDGTLVENVKAPVRGHLPIDPSVLDYIRNAMYDVPLKGTAQQAFAGFPMNQVKVGGKTGTAEVDVQHGLATAWFASFAGRVTDAKPRFVTVIMVDKGGQGGVIAAPAVRKVWDAVFGVEGHKAFLKRMGQLDRLRTELPENAEPLVPKRWSELNTMTIAFGQGLNVAPLQALMAVGALVNGGMMMKPTFLKRGEAEAQKDAVRVVRPEVSESMRYLLRLNAEIGSAKLANIPGYYIGGKTGTADKIVHGHYSKDRVFTTFMAIAPADKPKYLTLVLFDEPQALPQDGGYHTAAYNAGAVTGRVIERLGPFFGLPPRFEPPTQPFPLLAKLGYGMANVPAAATHGGH